MNEVVIFTAASTIAEQLGPVADTLAAPFEPGRRNLFSESIGASYADQAECDSFIDWLAAETSRYAAAFIETLGDKI